MPPRRRPKKGDRRIDAAIDHFTPMGYSSADIRAVVKQLLEDEVYGSNGWPFLEEDSYRVVQDTLFEKQEHEEQLQLQLLHRQEEDEEQVEEEPQPQLQPLQQELEEDEEPKMEQRQLQLLQQEDDIQEEEPQAMSVDLPAVAAILPPPAARRPCYGWLSESDTESESDNEEHPRSLLSKRKCPSRWDMRPLNW